MTAPTPDDVARLVKKLRARSLYEGSGEETDIGEDAADEIEALAAQVATLQAQVEAVRAKHTRAKKIVAKVYNRVTLIADDMCDEGDRVYLGSTNSADLLRDLRKEWDEAQIMGAEPLTAVEEATAYRRRAKTAETNLTASRARIVELEGALASRGEELTKAWHRVEAADEMAATISAPRYGMHGMPSHVSAALKRYKAVLTPKEPT